VKGIIFDLDGVLVDSMPAHFQAWKAAFEKVAELKITERDIYLLEGMRGMELVSKIFEQKGFPDNSTAKAVHDEKSRIFKEIRSSAPFPGVKEMIDSIKCKKAVVSGSTRSDVETIIAEAFGNGKFNVIITADDIKKGKPDPSAFLEALRQMNVDSSDALVVENAPLGAKAAKIAGINCYVALNNSPLRLSDFDGIIAHNAVFEKTGSLKGILEGLCR
jgi:beta-phosphoglucomutase